MIAIEWWTTATASLRDRTLTVSSLPQSLSAVTSAAGEIVKSDNVWEDIPGASTMITTAGGHSLARFGEPKLRPALGRRQRHQSANHGQQRTRRDDGGDSDEASVATRPGQPS